MQDLAAMLQREGDIARSLERVSGLTVYPASVVFSRGDLLFLGRQRSLRQLGILTAGPGVAAFQVSVRPVRLGGSPRLAGAALTLALGDLSHANAVALRARVPYTAPIRVGLAKSAGLGDRLGTATPGHIRALRHSQGIVPVLAQQSIREMERTQRSPQQVMDDATWGVFQEGWREGYGADADHLKTEQDIDACVAAGFVMYTFDPRDQVDNDAETDPVSTLAAKFAALPWERLETTPAATRVAYQGNTWPLGDGVALALTEEQLLRAACKYGAALAHLVGLYRHLVGAIGGRSFELEVSVDETDTPTRPEEHFYIASELRRLGVEWVSLAPRSVGRFEKGVDYIGDLAEFEATFARHVAVAKALGPYKLSIHSGSDKFSIYPIAARLAGDLVHLKTAGTSYLEALRAVAQMDPALFREIYQFALEHYETDRRTYHVSAELAKAPSPAALADADLPSVLDQFDARQALHVTFGTALTERRPDGATLFRDRLYAVLDRHEEAHYRALETHILRHLQPFSD
ncbi:MAG: tagaturonate epimerase family protein [Chloroflexota bacterium]